MKQIYVIYNPISTGNGKALAIEFKKQLRAYNPKITVEIVNTEFAGHAIELARELSGPDTVIISSSGDGGFNEVVNGVLDSDYPRAIVGVLPGGNANDHYEMLSKGNLIDRLVNKQVTPHDILKMSWNNQHRYAHSYIGVGLTADIGEEITATKVNPVNEKLIVLKGLFSRSPLTISVNGRTHYIDSLIFAVITRMSKYINTGTRPEGEFTVIRTRHRSLLTLLKTLLKRVIIQPTEDQTASSYRFTALKSATVQCDGETVNIPAQTEVLVECLPKALLEIV